PCLAWSGRAVGGGESGCSRAARLLPGLEPGQIVLTPSHGFMSVWTHSSGEHRFTHRLFSCLLHKDYASVAAVHSGDWINRLTSDTREVTGGVLSIFPSLAGMTVRLAGAMAALFFLTPTFFYILIPMGLILLVVTASFRKVLK